MGYLVNMVVVLMIICLKCDLFGFFTIRAYMYLVKAGAANVILRAQQIKSLFTYKMFKCAFRVCTRLEWYEAIRPPQRQWLDKLMA